MNPTDLFDEVAISFPPMWPQDPNWAWVNVHDGQKLKAEVILELLDRVLGSSDVIVLVHSHPGVALRMRKGEVANRVAEYILKHDIQVSDVGLNHFLSVSTTGLATYDA